MTVKAIHHFEDQPEEMRWLASVLLNRYWLHHSEWIVNDGSFQESDYPKQSSFKLRLGSETITILHRLYESAEDFMAALDSIARGDVVLLDVSRGSRTDLPGLLLYDAVVKIHDQEDVFVLTAWPDLARGHGIRSDHIIVKPPDPATLITMIVERFAIGVLD
jgi:hypothetical protein